MKTKEQCECGHNPCDNPDKFKIHFSEFSPEFKMHGIKDYLEAICPECGTVIKEKLNDSD